MQLNCKVRKKANNNNDTFNHNKIITIILKKYNSKIIK